MKRLGTTTDVCVIHCPVGGGHAAAANAIRLAAEERGLTVRAIDAFAHVPPWFRASYVGAHLTGQKMLPGLYGAAYHAADTRAGTLEPLRRGFDQLVLEGLVREVSRLAPGVVIATHHLPLVALGRARRMGRLAAPLVGVVTDYTAHAAWAERGVDAFAVANDAAIRELRRHLVHSTTIVPTGIPVRPSFDAVASLVPPDGEEPLSVLVTTGGFGVGSLSQILRGFSRTSRPAKITVVCGKNEALVRRTVRVASRLGLSVEVLGFVPDMTARYAAAHVVVGKAGGLTVTEALTSGRPLVLAGVIPGNEGANARFVEAGGGGTIARPIEAAFAAHAMRDAGLARYAAAARSLVPRGSAARVVDVALSLSTALSMRAA